MANAFYLTWLWTWRYLILWQIPFLRAGIEYDKQTTETLCFWRGFVKCFHIHVGHDVRESRPGYRGLGVLSWPVESEPYIGPNKFIQCAINRDLNSMNSIMNIMIIFLFNRGSSKIARSSVAPLVLRRLLYECCATWRTIIRHIHDKEVSPRRTITVYSKSKFEAFCPTKFISSIKFPHPRAKHSSLKWLRSDFTFWASPVWPAHGVPDSVANLLPHL